MRQLAKLAHKLCVCSHEQRQLRHICANDARTYRHPANDARTYNAMQTRLQRPGRDAAFPQRSFGRNYALLGYHALSPGPGTFVTHISHQIGFGFDCFMHSSESMPSRRLPSVLKTHITPLLKACLYYKEI